MTEIPDDKFSALREMASALHALLEALDTTPEVPQQIQESVNAKVAKGVCLFCEKPLGPGSARGLCKEHHNEANYKIRKNRWVENDLIMSGMMLPKSTRGTRRRVKQTAFDKELAVRKAELSIPPVMKEADKEMRRNSPPKTRPRKERK